MNSQPDWVMGENQSKPEITDTSHITGDFSELNGPTRVHALLEMVKICGYQEQLDFEEKLQELLYKDFITQLPVQLAEHLIFYLGLDDAINCLAVSKNWKRVIGGCTSYWTMRAEQVGLSRAFIKSRLSDISCNIYSLCGAALKQQKCMKDLVPHTLIVSQSPVAEGFSYVYAGNGVSLRYEELNAHAQVTIEYMDTLRSIEQIAMFDVASFSGRIKWVAASSDYVLWKQVDGKWRGCNIKSLVTRLDKWDDEPVSQGFHSISFCSKCHLVALMTEAEDDCEVWDLNIIKLVKGDSSGGSSPLHKMVYPIPLERVQNIQQKKRYFLGGEVTLLPASLESDSTGFCQSHSVLLQIDSNLAIHTLEAVNNSLIPHQLLPDRRLSKPLQVFSPKQLDQPISLLDFSGTKNRPSFTVSADLERVSMLYESYLYVWNLATYEEESFVDLINLNLPNNTKVVAIGSVYAILASNASGLWAVILVGTGEIVLQGSVADSVVTLHGKSTNCFNFFAPIHQEWLGSFALFDFWPLGLVIDNFSRKQLSTEKKEQEFLALVGVRSQRKPVPPPLTLAANDEQF